MKTCSDSHEEIIYTGKECPLCRERLLMDQLLDDREDINETNIMDLYKEISNVDERLGDLEDLLGLQPARRWRWFPFRYARASKQHVEH